LKVQGQLYESGKIQDVAEIDIERPIVPQWVVVVEPGSEVVADIAGISIGAKELPPVTSNATSERGTPDPRRSTTPQATGSTVG